MAGGAAAWPRLATTLARSLAARHRPLPCPDLLTSSSPRGFANMGDSVQKSGSADTTRVLFCGPYWPASTIYTKEYLQNHPFIQFIDENMCFIYLSSNFVRAPSYSISGILSTILARSCYMEGNMYTVDEVGLEEVPDVIQNYHLCVVKNRRVDSDVIAKANQMKIIMQYGVGIEGIDVNAATKHKIKVARIPGSTTGNAISCAEMAIYLTLGVLRKQVLILGFGAIGVEVAKRLRPFGVKILATKRNWSSDTLPCDIDELVDKKGGPEDMYELAGEADIVITCLLLTKETVGIVDHKFLSAMKKGSYLVNIARGGLLDYDAVFNHLKSGHLGGLGIDVAWTEPYDPEDPILKFPNVIITPHIAGVTEYSYRTMAKVVGDVALKLHSGEPITEVEFVN
uniref:Erythronate-4-phosphate+dehydrogenase+domain+containing+protein n=1 Tax=Oryza brachyantha TaxID=4533 RepID=G8JBA6_ORYBR|nr:erythronate-4-phosphate+dehydrogenase+domain+containing+protein [Oryza brachyantha]